MNVKEFCRDNFDLVDDLRDFFGVVRAAKLAQDFPGFHFDGRNNSGEFGFEMSRYAGHESYEATKARFAALCLDLFGDWDTAKLVCRHPYLSQSVWRLKEGYGGLTCSASGPSDRIRLYDMILHALRGTPTADLAEANALEDSSRQGDTLTIEGAEITVRVFQNGRFDLKGFSEDQTARILAMYETLTLYRHLHSQYQRLG